MNPDNKIMITGGHVTPALAVIEKIRARHPDWEIVFVGRKYALEGDTTVSEEYRMVTEKRLRFLAITTGRLLRRFDLSLFSLFKLPLGFIQAVRYVANERPTLVLSFGGYVAIPVVVVSWCFRIPIVTHEQTRRMGLANRLISYFARYICVSFPDTAGKFFQRKTIYTGLPIRAALFFPGGQLSFSIPHGSPILFITGGSAGAVSLNQKLFPAIHELIKRFVVIHQTGRRSIEKAQDIKRRLPKTENDRYIPMPFLKEADMSWILQHSSIVMARSGANTVMELAMLGKVAILIPLPWSASGEQLINAQFLREATGATILSQEGLTTSLLLERIDYAYAHRKKLTNQAAKLKKMIKLDGADAILDVLEKITGSLPRTE